MLLALAETSGTAALPHLVKLARAVVGEAAGKQVGASLVRALLPVELHCGGPGDAQRAQQHCAAALAPCSARQLRLLPELLGTAPAGPPARAQAAAVAQLSFIRLHGLAQELGSGEEPQQASLAEIVALAQGERSCWSAIILTCNSCIPGLLQEEPSDDERCLCHHGLQASSC